MAPETAFVENDICRHRSVINRRSLSIFSRRGVETPVPTVLPIAMRKPSTSNANKRMKSAKNKAPGRKTGTILRAVPMADAPTTAPLSSLEQEMATSPNEEILTAIGRPSPPLHMQSFSSPPQSHPETPRTYSVKSAKFSPIRTTRKEKTSPRTTSNPEYTIGVWKDGRVRWEGEPSIPLVRQASDAFAEFERTSVRVAPATDTKGRRPRIQVIIPEDQRHRPFATLPFLTHTNSAVKSTAAESDHDVSPPSGTGSQSIKRHSTVSPLSTQMPRPIRPFAFTSKPLGMAELDLEPPISMHKAKPSTSTSSDDSQGEDECSNYSKRSSMTSVEGTSPSEIKPISLHARSGSSFSVTSPVVAGVFNESPQSTTRTVSSNIQDVEICLRVPLAQSLPARPHGLHPALEDDRPFEPSCLRRPGRSVSYVLPRRRVPSLRRRSSKRGVRHATSSVKMENLDRAIAKTDFAVRPKSPTLSEAENDLEAHLTSITEDNPFQWDDIIEDQGPPPAVPRKSSKRMSQMIPSFRLSRVPSNHIASQIKRNHSAGKAKDLTIAIPASKRMTDEFVLSPIPVAPTRVERNITPQCAENVILSILQSLQSLDDLFATAVVNKGFYRVFKRHELELMKSALRKMSPPAWEHREICPPENTDAEEPETAHPAREYDPTTYLQYYMRDMYVIAALKSLILDQCQSLLRPEIAKALASNDQEESSRVDDAFWRISTFCKIFGCGKGREEDVIGQMDWLKGGELVHQQGSRATIVTADVLDMNSTLVNAPECFAKGNKGGLTAEQLYDMTEIWTCLGVLLQGFEGRTIQAREYGVFDSTEVRGGDIDGEEVMLDEWSYYLLTQGLSAIIDLATPCRQKDSSAFILAAENGWMEWKPPASGGSRRNFLREAVSRVYEDKIAASFSSNSQKEMLRQISKARIQRHISEIQRRKTSGERIPEIRMSQERPMSEWENVMDNLNRARPRSMRPRSKLPSPLPPLRSPAPNAPLSPLPTPAHSARASQPSQSSPRPQFADRLVASPLLPTPPPSSTASAHPVFLQHPLQRDIYHSGNADNTADKAIYRIVEMGFTADQARHALRVTDLGDGLRVDRAVELLLRADN